MIHRTHHTAATPIPRRRRVAAACPGARRGSCLRLPGGHEGPSLRRGWTSPALAAWLVVDPSRLGAVLRRLQADPNWPGSG